MNSFEIRKRFLDFFEKRGHSIIPSASLIPENDPSVLFTTAGMQPLVPYLLGESHPSGTRLANLQKCVRMGDIDEVGDNTHLTFFEMMGNWSLGDYFKEEAIKWSYEFLTSKEEGLGLDPERLYITAFQGNEQAPKDKESAKIWQSLGIPENRIYYQGVDCNWWPAVGGEDTWSGPTGPCSEMFYDVTESGLGDMTFEEFQRADDEQKVVEIWNDVFMEYEKKDGKIIGELKKRNVDTGAGFERVVSIMQGKDNVFDTDIFIPIIDICKNISSDEKKRKIIADHIRTATFMIADGVIPSNTDRGYVLRRLIRRAIFNTNNKSLEEKSVSNMVNLIEEIYKHHYSNIKENSDNIKKTIIEESNKFSKTLQKGYVRLKKLANPTKEFGDNQDVPNTKISGKDLFNLFSTYGFPFELSIEEIQKIRQEMGLNTLPSDRLEKIKSDYEKEFEEHQKKSRTASAGKFKGGLGGHSDIEVKYHTVTHLLNAALREVLGEEVSQKGSNINSERMRFDFSYPEKLTDEQKTEVENLVNDKIKESLKVFVEEMDLDKAYESGATGVFGESYPDKVKVYTIGNEKEFFSKEICGGPHVENTKDLGEFKIKKEESISAGVRRIKAVLE